MTTMRHTEDPAAPENLHEQPGWCTTQSEVLASLAGVVRGFEDPAVSVPVARSAELTERITGLVSAFERLCDSHVALWDGRIGSAAETHRRCVDGIGEVELALVREFMSVITSGGEQRQEHDV